MKACKVSLDRKARFTRLLESIQVEDIIGSEVKSCLECGCNYVSAKECPRCSSKHTSLVGSVVDCEECDEIDDFEFEELEVHVGNKNNIEDENAINEATKKVVRDGELVKVTVKKKKSKLTSKQKAALRKARKKANSASAQKKRAKSMKVRRNKLKEGYEIGNEFQVVIKNGQLTKELQEDIIDFCEDNDIPTPNNIEVKSNTIIMTYEDEDDAYEAYDIISDFATDDSVNLIDSSSGEVLEEVKRVKRLSEAFDISNSYSVSILGGGLSDLLMSMSDKAIDKFMKLNKIPKSDGLSVNSHGLVLYYKNQATAKKAHFILKKLSDYDDVELIDERTGELLAESVQSASNRTMIINESYRPELRPGIILVSEMTNNAHIVANQLGFRGTKSKDKFIRRVNENKLILEKCSGDIKGLAIYGVDSEENFLSEHNLNSLLESIDLQLN